MILQKFSTFQQKKTIGNCKTKEYGYNVVELIIWTNTQQKLNIKCGPKYFLFSFLKSQFIHSAIHAISSGIPNIFMEVRNMNKKQINKILNHNQPFFSRPALFTLLTWICTPACAYRFCVLYYVRAMPVYNQNERQPSSMSAKISVFTYSKWNRKYLLSAHNRCFPMKFRTNWNRACILTIHSIA